MVSFSSFHDLDPQTADLARELIENVAHQRSPFMSFMSAWMAFNGWMECVTDARSDRQMIDMIAEHRRATDAYEALLQDTPQFQRCVIRFAAMWPVVNVRDARRKLGRDVFWQLERAEFLDECRRNNVQLDPQGWAADQVPTWPQLLRTIYAVRCNLFHGAKSPQNIRDGDLVRHADRIMRAYIEGSRCFDWRD
jgi:hypothetical protein